MKTKLLALLLTLTIVVSCLGSVPFTAFAAGTYNANDVAKLTAFANQNDNLAQLGWDLSDPSSWDYVEWIEVAGELRLEMFDVYYSNLTLSGNLDLSGCTELYYLDFDNNGEGGNLSLTSVDVSGCSNLAVLWCNNNQITSLDLNGCISLQGLYCQQNRLTELDVTGLIGLKYIDTRYNYINMGEKSAPGTYVTGIGGVPDFIAWDYANEYDYSSFNFSPQHAEGFVAVTKITDLPAEAAANVPLTLAGTVNPSDATNQNIKWSIEVATDGLNPKLSGNVLTANKMGAIMLCATVENGRAVGEDYTQYFIIFVSAAPLPGDADGDGNVTAKDATTILRYLFWDYYRKPLIDLENANVDGDGNVTAKDATIILRHLFWTGDKQPPLL
jgi:Leucine-rich repeat (LRR) protein